MPDYYETLGVGRNATIDEIKQAYRKLARKYHPDVASNKAEAEHKFKEINEAYSILSDPEKKQQYDLFGSVEARPGMGTGDFGFGFEDMFGGDIFDAFFGFGRQGRRRSAARAQRGSDIRHDLEITLEEAFNGIEKDIPLGNYQTCIHCKGSRSEPGSELAVCEVCHGTGEMRSVHSTPFGQVIRSYTCSRCQGEGRIVRTPCSHCHGEGRIYKKRAIHVRIPAGVDTGSRIRIPGEGEAGIYGGPDGDLYIFIHVKPHELFERQENDIIYNINMTFTDAALGSELEVPALDGKTNLKIPSGTQNGTVFKLKGKGMPNLRTGKRGDQLVTVSVMIPTRLNEKQKQLLREFAKSGSQEAEKGFFDKLKGTFKIFLP